MSTDEGERLTTKSSGQVSWDKRPGILGGIALAVVLLAAALRIYRLDWQSVWVDEVFSLIVAAPSQRFEEFWGWVLTDVHPPLYYLLLRIWSGILGQSEAATRSLSAIFGVLTVAAAGIVFRPALSPVGRVSLMLLFAVSPAAIQYSQEVRSYALLIFLATLLTGLCTHHLRASSPREANRVVAVLTLVAVLASFTHYFGFLFAVTALFTCLVGTIDDRGRSWGVITGIVVVVATFLPWVIYHGQFMAYGRQSSVWIGHMPIELSVDWFVRLCFGGWLAFAGFAGPIVVGLLLSTEFRRTASRDRITRAALALCGLTFMEAVAISLHTPILTSRNMVVVLPAIYFLVAHIGTYALNRLNPMLCMVLPLGQVVLLIWPLPGYYTYIAKEQWRESAAYVLNQPNCEAATIYVYGEAIYYRHFTQTSRPMMRLVEVPYSGTADLSDIPDSPCRIVLWAARLSRVEVDRILPELSLQPTNLKVVEFDEAFVILRK